MSDRYRKSGDIVHVLYIGTSDFDRYHVLQWICPKLTHHTRSCPRNVGEFLYYYYYEQASVERVSLQLAQHS